jgi:hypothetical protein
MRGKVAGKSFCGNLSIMLSEFSECLQVIQNKAVKKTYLKVSQGNISDECGRRPILELVSFSAKNHLIEKAM